MHHPTDRITHTTSIVTPVVEHWLEREIAQSHEGSIRRTITPWANALTTELHLAPIAKECMHYVCMYVCMYWCMTTSIYCVCRVWLYIHRLKRTGTGDWILFGLTSFGFKPLLGLEPMAPICPQLLVSHANHSATETSIMYVFMYICVYVCMYICVCM